MNKTQPQAIIFDFYGVLALNGWQAFKALHFSDREDVWTEIFQLGRKVDAGLASYDELVRFTAGKSGETEATVRYQMEHTVANAELLSYIRTTLKPHHRLGILSNARSNEVIEQVLSKDEEALFDAIVLSHHVGLTKPDTRMYEAVASKLDVPVEACLFVDDQERHAAGARYAGMQALVYTDLTDLKKELGT